MGERDRNIRHVIRYLEMRRALARDASLSGCRDRRSASFEKSLLKASSLRDANLYPLISPLPSQAQPRHGIPPRVPVHQAIARYRGGGSFL